MFLRSLQIRGFKSFADKPLLDFAPGISVIVGPNGSGKSNLVDAIAWVLGEQGPRALRGGQMADVIFAGSPARAALGMAEVKLVIDNSAGLIPVPMLEIEISRTIFRSGESEYRIGGQLVRLLDVQELLSETGIGRALHTVVGQGQLEDVLTSRAEERRQYIEEAAGVAKHRKRKERAERKLAGLDQDVLRLQDVLAELKRQLKPLRQQAEMAKRHEELTAQADELAWRLAAARLRSLLEDRDRRKAGWDEGLERRKAARELLDALDEDVARAADDRERTSRELFRTEAVMREAQAARSASEHALREAVERESDARAALAAEATLAGRIAAIDEEVTRVEADIEHTLVALADRERALEEAEREFREREQDRRRVEDERRRLFEVQAGRRAEAETMRRSLEGYERERDRLAAGLDSVRGRLREVEAEREGLESEIEALDARQTPLAERRSALEEERRRLTHRVDELEDAIRRHESRKEVLELRLGDVVDTPGTRFLRSRGDRAIGLLRDLIRARDGLEKALLAALGPLADAVVYEDGERALADAPGGDGAILAIASGGPVAFKLLGERSLLSAVSAEPAARGLASTVLRDVYVAETIEEAAEKHREHPAASFVTREGVLVGPAVIHTATGDSDLAREIRAELAVVDHDLQGARHTVRPKRDRLEEIVGELDAITEEMAATDAEITRAAERLAASASDLASFRKEEEIIGQRVASLDESAGTWRESLAGAEPEPPEPPELPPAAEPPIRVRVEVETLRRDRAALDERLHRLRADREELSTLDPAMLRAELEETVATRSEAEEALRSSEETDGAATAARDEAAAAQRAAADAETDGNRRWRQASADLEHLRDEYEEDDRVRGDLERRIRDAERLLREGHQTEPAEAVAALSDEDRAEALEKRAELVQRRLALLGRVNLLANEEFASLQERHDFLARELDDVRKARRDLLEVIRRIEEEITETFDAAWRDVAVQFERLFAELFPGGEGRLVLTDPANPLETGIEIEARPGRKRVKRISLLSGGERALTAMAFLFSIFKARPSPFYLMDEVEPALDDVNLHRFIKLVRDFADESQVLVVTHQKKTMEVADMMYGVSMSKDGTSKVVAQRLEHPADVSGNGKADGEAARIVTVPEPDVVG